MTTKTSKPKKKNAEEKGHKAGDSQAQKEEGRTHQRVPVQLLVDYRSDGNYLFDFCRDLGTGGVFIETAHPLSHGSTVELTFTLPDSKETLEARGRVIWVQTAVPGKELTPGMGVQFEDFTPEQRQLLHKFVERYSRSDGQGKPSNKSA